jgi:hypothetical protein
MLPGETMDAVEANTKLQPVRDQFLVRFYQWARKDILRESREGFPFVRRIANPAASRFLEFAGSLRESDASAFYSGVVKQAHRRAVELLREFASLEEMSLLEQYRKYIRSAPPAALPRSPRTIRMKLRKALLSGLAPALGSPVEIFPDGAIWMYHTPIKCWTLRTNIDTGGNRLAGYWHAIVAREPVFLHDHVSLLSWLGIGQTDWIQAREEDYAGMVDCMVELHAHFSKAAARLLEGLSHDLPELEPRGWRELVEVKSHRKNGLTILFFNSPEMHKIVPRVTWEIPTSMIPAHLRAIGSHFVLVQDPLFCREAGDPLAKHPKYRHLRVEPAQPEHKRHTS